MLITQLAEVLIGKIEYKIAFVVHLWQQTVC